MKYAYVMKLRRVFYLNVERKACAELNFEKWDSSIKLMDGNFTFPLYPSI